MQSDLKLIFLLDGWYLSSTLSQNKYTATCIKPETKVSDQTMPSGKVCNISKSKKNHLFHFSLYSFRLVLKYSDKTEHTSWLNCHTEVKS